MKSRYARRQRRNKCRRAAAGGYVSLMLPDDILPPYAAIYCR